MRNWYSHLHARGNHSHARPMSAAPPCGQQSDARQPPTRSSEAKGRRARSEGASMATRSVWCASGLTGPLPAPRATAASGWARCLGNELPCRADKQSRFRCATLARSRPHPFLGFQCQVCRVQPTPMDPWISKAAR